MTVLAALAKAIESLAGALQGKNPPVSVSHSLPPAPPAATLTITELVNEFLLAKARAGRSDRYLRTLRNSLSKFNHGRGRVLLSGVTPALIETWLAKSDWAARTRKGYLSDVRILFNYALKRGYLSQNPAAAVELPGAENLAPPAVHTPAQVAAVLAFARRYDLNLCRALSIRYFAGLRSSEVDTLEESEIHQDRGIIEVQARKAKTRRRRPVDIAPNLAAWLALGGRLPLGDRNNRWRWFTAELLAATQVAWPQNVCRHSFISYHLARGQSAAATALQAGNTEAMVFAHYRQVVSRPAALAYFGIYPETTEQPTLPGLSGSLTL